MYNYAPGQSPLDPDEAAGLIPEHINTQGPLDEWEQANILAGSKWADKQKKRELLSDPD